MRERDWIKGIYAPIPLLVECFQTHSRKPLGVEFKIRASSQFDADTQTKAILEQHHGNFLRRTHGMFTTRFSNIRTHK